MGQVVRTRLISHRRVVCFGWSDLFGISGRHFLVFSLGMLLWTRIFILSIG